MQYSECPFLGSKCMSINLRKTSRNFHLWLSLAIFIPVVVVIGSGLLLQVKKEFDWLQPPTQKAAGNAPSLSLIHISEPTRPY